MARQPSIMNHNFARIPQAHIPRSSFDRSSSHKTAIDSGFLYPIFVDEALPGDTFNLSMTAFGRLATPLRPFMDNIACTSFFFFVPMRLVWANWMKFMGEQDNPGDSTDYLIPNVFAPAGGYAENSIQDYMGIPTKVPDIGHSVLPLRAYNLIWNTWFRDQNLQQSVRVNLGDEGTDAANDFTLLRRGKRHDYFTSALPWPQKGAAVDIPLGAKAPVVGIGNTANTYTGPVSVYETDKSSMVSYPAASALGPDVSTWFVAQGDVNGRPGVYADLSEASAATINQLRQAFQIQKLRERDARGGTRYTEIVRAHFNVVSPDARLQRPEYLGGGSGFVNLHTVPQTSGSPGDGGYTNTPQGSLSAYGTTTLHNNGFTHSFTEHGIILGLISVRADLNYQQGINRMWSRRTKYDFYWPALSMIGEQAILNKEIYAQGYNVPGGGQTPTDDLVFGYQERFAEYRYRSSLITGEMRSNATQSLDIWHLAQEFATLPLLNAAFIEDNPPIERVLAVPTEREFIFDMYFRLRCARPMPVYGVPGMIDHF